MPNFIFQNALAIAAAAAVAAMLLALEAKLDIDTSIIALGGLFIILAILVGLIFILKKRITEREGKTRQSVMVVERLQAMLATAPVGYCLFTPQGVLREAVRMAPILGIEKVAHVEDIVGAIKEATEFLAAFRKMLVAGESFSLQVETTQNKKRIQITGRRFRIGREGPLIDALWFAEVPQDAAASEVVQNTKTETEPQLNQSVTLFDALSFPSWQRNVEGALVSCNSAYATAVDATREDVIVRQVELVSQASWGGSGRTLAANAVAADRAQTERRHVIIAGKRRLLEITEKPIKNEVGQVVGLVGFAIDISTEEEKDTELQRHLTAQNEVLEHLGSAIAIYGPDTRLEFYNRAYLRLWDADENFLNGRPTFGEVLEDLRTRRRAPEQADFPRYKKERSSLFTSLLEPREDSMHLPDGTTLRILAVPHPFGGIMFVHEDVTDKLALESSYNTLIAVQRETLDNLAEGIAVFGPDGKLRLHNPAFAGIWQVATAVLDANPHVADLLEHMKPLFNYGSNWGGFKNEMVEYTLDRNPHKGRIERADQSVIEYSTTPLPDGAVLNSYLDVSDSIKAEQALRASNAALATADRLKSEFVANVSYQLRTPLNTIMGFSEILTNQYFGTLNERQLEYTRTIMEASKRLLLLINDVLDLATIEAGRMALNRVTVSIAELLNAAKQMTSEWARQQSLEIVIDCPTAIGTFDVDEQRMKQVIFNLISNAIKYTPSGGRITLEARRVEPWITISVIDTGVGIPDTDRDRVFGKFERTNTHVRQAGAGLGLSLVKSFVELHGGRIELESKVNGGTRVTCYLPIANVGDTYITTVQ
jgi:signal transduction histidine kinase/PAS domain-containing protein